MKLVLGVDLDGVCYPFEQRIRALVARTKNTRPEDLSEPVTWNFYEQWDLNRDQFVELWSEGVRTGEIFREGDPYPHVKAALQQLYDHGHEIQIITARHLPGLENECETHTLDWLATYDIPHHGVTIVRNGEPKNGDTCPLVDLMVDDKAANGETFEGTDSRYILHTRPWNIGAPYERVPDLLEFADLVDDHSERLAHGEQWTNGTWVDEHGNVLETTALRTATPSHRKATLCDRVGQQGGRCQEPLINGTCPTHT